VTVIYVIQRLVSRLQCSLGMAIEAVLVGLGELVSTVFFDEGE
jgi:hypothetical protein